MKKLFISQPMRGKSDETVLAERADAIQAVKDLLGEDVEVLDTWFVNFDGKALEFLGKSIMMMAQADVAYFAPDGKMHVDAALNINARLSMVYTRLKLKEKKRCSQSRLHSFLFETFQLICYIE